MSDDDDDVPLRVETLSEDEEKHDWLYNQDDLIRWDEVFGHPCNSVESATYKSVSNWAHTDPAETKAAWANADGMEHEIAEYVTAVAELESADERDALRHDFIERVCELVRAGWKTEYEAVWDWAHDVMHCAALPHNFETKFEDFFLHDGANSVLGDAYTRALRDHGHLDASDDAAKVSAACADLIRVYCDKLDEAVADDDEAVGVGLVFPASMKVKVFWDTSDSTTLVTAAHKDTFKIRPMNEPKDNLQDYWYAREMHLFYGERLLDATSESKIAALLDAVKLHCQKVASSLAEHVVEREHEQEETAKELEAIEFIETDALKGTHPSPEVITKVLKIAPTRVKLHKLTVDDFVEVATNTAVATEMYTLLEARWGSNRNPRRSTRNDREGSFVLTDNDLVDLDGDPVNFDEEMGNSSANESDSASSASAYSTEESDTDDDVHSSEGYILSEPASTESDLDEGGVNTKPTKPAKRRKRRPKNQDASSGVGGAPDPDLPQTAKVSRRPPKRSRAERTTEKRPITKDMLEIDLSRYLSVAPYSTLATLTRGLAAHADLVGGLKWDVLKACCETRNVDNVAATGLLPPSPSMPIVITSTGKGMKVEKSTPLKHTGFVEHTVRRLFYSPSMLRWVDVERGVRGGCLRLTRGTPFPAWFDEESGKLTHGMTKKPNSEMRPAFYEPGVMMRQKAYDYLSQQPESLGYGDDLDASDADAADTESARRFARIVVHAVGMNDDWRDGSHTKFYERVEQNEDGAEWSKIKHQWSTLTDHKGTVAEWWGKVKQQPPMRHDTIADSPIALAELRSEWLKETASAKTKAGGKLAHDPNSRELDDVLLKRKKYFKDNFDPHEGDATRKRLIRAFPHDSVAHLRHSRAVDKLVASLDSLAKGVAHRFVEKHKSKGYERLDDTKDRVKGQFLRSFVWRPATSQETDTATVHALFDPTSTDAVRAVRLGTDYETTTWTQAKADIQCLAADLNTKWRAINGEHRDMEENEWRGATEGKAIFAHTSSNAFDDLRDELDGHYCPATDDGETLAQDGKPTFEKVYRLRYAPRMLALGTTPVKSAVQMEMKYEKALERPLMMKVPDPDSYGLEYVETVIQGMKWKGSAKPHLEGGATAARYWNEVPLHAMKDIAKKNGWLRKIGQCRDSLALGEVAKWIASDETNVCEYVRTLIRRLGKESDPVVLSDRKQLYSDLSRNPVNLNGLRNTLLLWASNKKDFDAVTLLPSVTRAIERMDAAKDALLEEHLYGLPRQRDRLHDKIYTLFRKKKKRTYTFLHVAWDGSPDHVELTLPEEESTIVKSVAKKAKEEGDNKAGDTFSRLLVEELSGTEQINGTFMECVDPKVVRAIQFVHAKNNLGMVLNRNAPCAVLKMTLWCKLALTNHATGTGLYLNSINATFVGYLRKLMELRNGETEGLTSAVQSFEAMVKTQMKEGVEATSRLSPNKDDKRFIGGVDAFHKTAQHILFNVAMPNMKTEDALFTSLLKFAENAYKQNWTFNPGGALDYTEDWVTAVTNAIKESTLAPKKELVRDTRGLFMLVAKEEVESAKTVELNLATAMKALRGGAYCPDDIKSCISHAHICIYEKTRNFATRKGAKDALVKKCGELGANLVLGAHAARELVEEHLLKVFEPDVLNPQTNLTQDDVLLCLSKAVNTCFTPDKPLPKTNPWYDAMPGFKGHIDTIVSETREANCPVEFDWQTASPSEAQHLMLTESAVTRGWWMENYAGASEERVKRDIARAYDRGRVDVG